MFMEHEKTTCVCVCVCVCLALISHIVCPQKSAKYDNLPLGKSPIRKLIHK